MGIEREAGAFVQDNTGVILNKTLGKSYSARSRGKAGESKHNKP